VRRKRQAISGCYPHPTEAYLGDVQKVSIPEPVVNQPINPSPVGLSKQHQDPYKEKKQMPADGPVVMEDCDDGWPGYEKPVFIHH
jgi:hypothetical protein